jgi:hypothetical protein
MPGEAFEDRLVISYSYPGPRNTGLAGLRYSIYGFQRALFNDAVNCKFRPYGVGDKWISMGRRWNYTDKETPKYSEKTLSQCRLVHGKLHL